MDSDASQLAETNICYDVKHAEYEYRLKDGRNQPVATRRVYHEPERAAEAAGLVASETNPGSHREREPDVSSNRKRTRKCTDQDRTNSFFLDDGGMKQAPVVRSICLAGTRKTTTKGHRNLRQRRKMIIAGET